MPWKHPPAASIITWVSWCLCLSPLTDVTALACIMLTIASFNSHPMLWSLCHRSLCQLLLALDQCRESNPQPLASSTKIHGTFVFPLWLTSLLSLASCLHHYTPSPSQCRAADFPGAYVTSSKPLANAVKAPLLSLTSLAKVHDSFSFVKAAYITKQDMWQLLAALVSTDHRDTW